MLGGRLKSARKSSGLSLRDLQSKIGNIVTAQAIGKYERDEMQPSAAILTLIANTLNVTEEYLRSTSGVQLGAIDFRENFIRSKKDEAQVASKIKSYLEHYLEIEELLRLDTVEWDQPREFPFIVRDLKDAELAALKVRDAWKLGNDSIQHLAEFLEDRGIKIILIDLPESISGVTCFVHRDTRKNVPTIVINKKNTGERQRFTMAHELGHLVMEKMEACKDMEKMCHRFASAFLMPEGALLANLGRNRSLVSLGELLSLKEIFGASVQAITYRCKDLGIINQSSYQNLFREFTKLGWRKPPYKEDFPLESEKTQRFKRLCFRAISEGSVDIEKIAISLGETVEEIRNEMNGIKSLN